MILIPVPPLRTAGIVALTALALGTRPAEGQEAQVEVARRLADVASIALDEYALGVVEGRVVNRAELEEAELFLAEARRLAGELEPGLSGLVGPAVDQLLAGVTARRPAAELREVLEGLRTGMESALGVALDPAPRGAPSLRAAESVYADLCSSCHGPLGRGDGPLAGGLDPPPADLGDPSLRATSPRDFFRKINVGVAGTAMPGFTDRLTEEQRWAIALYASGLRYGDAERRAGAEVFRRRCPQCLARIASFAEIAGVTDDSLGVLLAGEMGLPPTESSVRAAVAYARTAAALEELGGDASLAAARVVERARSGVRAAVAAAVDGDRAAAGRQALDAYLVFEEIESAVRARHARAAGQVERAFADLRGAVAAGGADGADEVQRAAARTEQALDAALRVLREASSPALLFGQSLIIMLREGFEAILIVGALIAFLSRAGAGGRKREIGWGVGAALVASLATAAAYATVFRRAVASQELVEGLTMLVAAVVLFWVSYWLVSKIELRKWQAFVASRMSEALSSRRALALAAVAFLAVYREGFETVLFYAALLASADRTSGAGASVGAGIVVGLGVLAVVYALMQRYGRRLPLKPFFAVTSALLYVMAFSFVGQGVAELQEAGYLPTTPLGWLPMLPALGIFPTMQTALLQALLVVALLAALLWVFWLEPRQQRAVAR